MWMDLICWFMVLTGFGAIFINTHYESLIGTIFGFIFFLVVLPPLPIFEPLEERVEWLRPAIFIGSWLISSGIAIYTLVI